MVIKFKIKKGKPIKNKYFRKKKKKKRNLTNKYANFRSRKALKKNKKTTTFIWSILLHICKNLTHNKKKKTEKIWKFEFEEIKKNLDSREIFEDF